jgi:hypothetical protein
METAKGQCLLGVEEDGESQEHRILSISNTLYNNTFVQAHRMYNTKNESSCKLWSLSDNDASTVTNVPLWQGILIVVKWYTCRCWGIWQISSTFT